ncbi:sugar transporter SWEET1 [Perca fluviatilis]|uniref:sugar transporter SWEET1 n=1 Tax=Perca fluviatilis TaxID=8168 RepID=UPI0019652EE2|nr:sugar transporter SWEET1 [Perca fluviatilis]
MDLLQFLSWACIVFTVGMFSTGLTDLKKMRESKNADNIQFLPFLTTCLNFYLLTDCCYPLLYLFPFQVKIVRSGDVQCLSFPLTVATFFTSTSWVLYGLQLNDSYIVVPNMPGIFTSLIRFYLFWRFAAVNQSSPSFKSMQI